MKHISSRDNPAVKALVKLAGLAGRRGASVLLDGVHLCRAWLDHHGLPEQAVFDAERLDQPELAALAAALPSERCLALDARLMQSLASVESGQGVAFVVAPPAPCRVPWTRIACCSTASRIRAMSAPCCAPARRPASSACSWPPARPPPGRRCAAPGAHFALAIHEHVDLAALLPRLRARWWRRRWTAPATCTALHCGALRLGVRT